MSTLIKDAQNELIKEGMEALLAEFSQVIPMEAGTLGDPFGLPAIKQAVSLALRVENADLLFLGGADFNPEAVAMLVSDLAMRVSIPQSKIDEAFSKSFALSNPQFPLARSIAASLKGVATDISDNTYPLGLQLVWRVLIRASIVLSIYELVLNCFNKDKAEALYQAYIDAETDDAAGASLNEFAAYISGRIPGRVSGGFLRLMNVMAKSNFESDLAQLLSQVNQASSLYDFEEVVKDLAQQYLPDKNKDDSEKIKAVIGLLAESAGIALAMEFVTVNELRALAKGSVAVQLPSKPLNLPGIVSQPATQVAQAAALVAKTPPAVKTAPVVMPQVSSTALPQANPAKNNLQATGNQAKNQPLIPAAPAQPQKGGQSSKSTQVPNIKVRDGLTVAPNKTKTQEAVAIGKKSAKKMGWATWNFLVAALKASLSGGKMGINFLNSLVLVLEANTSKPKWMIRLALGGALLALVLLVVGGAYLGYQMMSPNNSVTASVVIPNEDDTIRRVGEAPVTTAPAVVMATDTQVPTAVVTIGQVAGTPIIRTGEVTNYLGFFSDRMKLDIVQFALNFGLTSEQLAKAVYNQVSAYPQVTEEEYINQSLIIDAVMVALNSQAQ